MEVAGDTYIDGGFVANTPILKALEEGAKRVVVDARVHQSRSCPRSSVTYHNIRIHDIKYVWKLYMTEIIQKLLR